MSVFSERLKKLRQDRKYSQTEAAQAMGISRAMLSNYERGIREPDFQLLCKIANFYRTTTDYLLGHGEGTHDSEQMLDTFLMQKIHQMCVSLSAESKEKLMEHIELLKLHDRDAEQKRQNDVNAGTKAAETVKQETREPAIAKK